MALSEADADVDEAAEDEVSAEVADADVPELPDDTTQVDAAATVGSAGAAVALDVNVSSPDAMVP